MRAGASGISARVRRGFVHESIGDFRALPAEFSARFGGRFCRGRGRAICENVCKPGASFERIFEEDFVVSLRKCWSLFFDRLRRGFENDLQVSLAKIKSRVFWRFACVVSREFALGLFSIFSLENQKSGKGLFSACFDV